ncbi:MAG: hypothetical protein KDB07_09025 [Planctomycetes bacterium]|nr:hypothetical protein [Planctomycetota bacterium]
MNKLAMVTLVLGCVLGLLVSYLASPDSDDAPAPDPQADTTKTASERPTRRVEQDKTSSRKQDSSTPQPPPKPDGQGEANQAEPPPSIDIAPIFEESARSLSEYRNALTQALQPMPLLRPNQVQQEAQNAAPAWNDRYKEFLFDNQLSKVDLVTASRHAKNRELLPRANTFLPPGYGQVIQLEVLVPICKQIPERMSLTLLPTVGGDEAYQMVLLRQTRGKVAPDASYVEELRESKDKIHYWPHASLQGKIIVPWLQYDSDFAVFDDLNAPSILAVVRARKGAQQLYLRPNETLQSSKPILVTVSHRDGRRAVGASVIYEGHVLAKTSDNGSAVIGTESYNILSSRSDVLEAFLPGYCRGVVGIDEMTDKGSYFEADIVLVSEMQTITASLPEQFSDYLITENMLLPYPRYGAGAQSEWPDWAPKERRRAELEMLVLFPSTADGDLGRIVPHRALAPIDQFRADSTLARESIAMGATFEFEELTSKFAERFARAVFWEYKWSLDRGPDTQGRYRIRLPKISGKVALVLRRSGGSSEGAGPHILELDLSEAERNKGGNPFRVADPMQEYKVFDSDPSTDRQHWCRYYYGRSLSRGFLPADAPPPTLKPWPKY